MSSLKGLILLLACLLSHAAYSDARLIIHLTDYLANDYSGAVGEDGKVLSQGGYDEQIEFGKKVLSEGLIDPKLKLDPTIVTDMKNLDQAIANKRPPSEVVPLARKIQQAAIRLSGIQLSPANWPDYAQAKELFQNNCISCHGPQGYGDGPDGKDLDPKPANFHDMERAPTISPFAAFNTIRLGVPGTGMAAWDLSDEDVWSLAFYVSSLRFGEPGKKPTEKFKIKNRELLKKAASLNDAQLQEYLVGQGHSAKMVEDVRLYSPARKLLSSLKLTTKLLNKSVELLQQGKLEEAKDVSMKAYFVGFEPLEQTIAGNDPDLVSSIEQKMADFRDGIAANDSNAVTQHHRELIELLNSAKPYLAEEDLTPAVAFASGFSIILREGFEAVLIIVAILGVGKAAASPMVNVSIHLGWIVSLILGFAGWILSGRLLSISGYSRELIEGLTSIVAVVILVYVGFWMHRQTEIQRWKEFIDGKVKDLVQTKNLIGLFTLSFIVSFREVMETVLFLRTIYSESATESNNAMLGGVAIAFVIVFGVALMLLRFRKRMPLQKFFNLSAALMMMLSVVLIGKGTHALQEAGLIGVNILKGMPRLELIGVYPSVQVLGAQVAVAILCVLIWKKGRKKT